VRFLLLSSSASSTLFIQSHPGPPFVDDYTAAMHLFIKAKVHVLSRAPRCDWQGHILVRCLAKLVKIQDKRIMRLFVGNTVNNGDVQLPIDSYAMRKTVDQNKRMARGVPMAGCWGRDAPSLPFFGPRDTPANVYHFSSNFVTY
jgi:hypothetical protein